MFDDDHIRRVRYNAACLTTNITSPGVHFKEVPDVIMIFVSKFDIFNARKTIYHVDRVVRETQQINDNGQQEIYVNAKVDDGSSIAKLMRIFKEQNAYDFKNFPKTSERKRYFKEDEGGRREMCEIVENYAREYAKEALKEKVAKKLEKGKSVEVIADELEEMIEVIQDIVEELQASEK